MNTIGRLGLVPALGLAVIACVVADWCGRKGSGGEG